MTTRPTIHRSGKARHPRASWLTGAVVAMAAMACGEDPQKPQAIVPPCVAEPCDPEAVVARLGDAYRTRSYAHYATLFHDDFLFALQTSYLPDPRQPDTWGKTEELRIHKRMFEPQNIGPNEEPLAPDLWLVAVDITLTGRGPWVERLEYYVSTVNPDGLDPLRWKAWGTEYTASVLLQTAGETDYQITGSEWFVVVQDLEKVAGEHGAFLLYQWQDLGALGVSMSPASAGPGASASGTAPAIWSSVKKLYR
jgi:hypothetical protein